MVDKVLITGSCGLVGSSAARYFSRFSSIIGLDNNNRKHWLGPEWDTDPVRHDLQKMHNFQYRYADLQYFDSVDQIVEREKPGLVIHCAGQWSPEVARKRPLSDFFTNGQGTVHILESVRYHCPHAIFVHVGTHLAEAPSGSKSAGETMVLDYGDRYQIRTVCFRCGPIVGTKEQQHGFLNGLTYAARNNQEFVFTGDESKGSDYLYAWDLVGAMHAFCDNPKIASTYDIGGGRENYRSYSGLIHKTQARKPFPVRYEAGENKDYCTNNDNFRRDYPAWSVSRGVDSMLDELLS